MIFGLFCRATAGCLMASMMRLMMGACLARAVAAGTMPCSTEYMPG